MDAGSSFQVLLSTAVLTTLLIATIRVIGTIAAKRLPDLPSPPTQPASKPLSAGADALRLIAVLTAAAMEALDSDDIYLSSIVELPEPGGHKHWPRVGKMHFYRKPGSAL